jgi:hypothetical protein
MCFNQLRTEVHELEIDGREEIIVALILEAWNAV